MMKGIVLYQFIKNYRQNNDNKELSECEGTGPFFNSF